MIDIYELCMKYSNGQYFKDQKFNQYIKNPHRFTNLFETKEQVNELYQTLLKCKYLTKIIRTPSGGIKRNSFNNEAWDLQEIRTEKGVFKGIIITVITHSTVFVFKAGAFGVKDKNITGKKCYAKVKKECEKQKVDLEKYAVSKEEGVKIKEQIEKPIIKNLLDYQRHEHVYHLDINGAWPAGCAKEYPELKEVFKNLKKKDKHVPDVFLGFCQSQYSDYRFADLARAGINNTNKYIMELVNKLSDQYFMVLGINTDGIWYKDMFGRNRKYTDENEGKELGQWKTDHKDCVFEAFSDGVYYYEEDGVFHPVARGFYSYECIKPREQWTKEDFFAAMNTTQLIHFIEGYGFAIEGE